MTDAPPSGVLPRRRPTTYAARPGFTPTARPGDAHQATAPGLDVPPAPQSEAGVELHPDRSVDPHQAQEPDLGWHSDRSDADGNDGDLYDDPLDDDGSSDGDVPEGDLQEDRDIEAADAIEVLYPPTEDPFDVTLVLAVDQPDLQLAVGARLTPPLIADLIEQLLDLQDEQHQAMGLPPATQAPDAAPDTDAADEGPEDTEGLTRRAADPLGLRHLRARSPKSTVYIACAIAALLVLSLLINHLT